MNEHIVDMETVNLLKTFCKLNPKFAMCVPLAIVSLSFDTMFWFRNYDDPEGIKFVCRVLHKFKEKL